MGDGVFLQMLAAAFAANMFTAMAVIGVVLFSRLEREARQEGRKASIPGYIYLMILLPAAMAVGTLYAVSSSGAASL